MQNTQLYRSEASLEQRIACLLALARLLCDLARGLPGRIHMGGPRIDRLLADLAVGRIFVEGEGDALEEMGYAVLSYFEKECPGHIETMFRGTLEDYPLRNPDWSAARSFWDVLLRYRMCRQEVLDEVQAARIAKKLRNAES